MVSKELRNAIKSQLAEGNVEEAIDLLVEESKHKEYYNVVITISGQFNELKEKTLMGILDEDDKGVQMNQIRYAILDFLDNDDITSIKVSREKKSTFSNQKIPLIIGGAIAAILLVGFFFFRNSTASNNGSNLNATSSSVHPCTTSNIFLLEGKINNKYSIHMKMNRTNAEESGVNGYYYYESTNKQIPIHGKIDQTGFVSLTATIIEGNGSKTEKFEGVFTESCELKGQWEAGGKVYAFKLQKQ